MTICRMKIMTKVLVLRIMTVMTHLYRHLPSHLIRPCQTRQREYVLLKLYINLVFFCNLLFFFNCEFF